MERKSRIRIQIAGIVLSTIAVIFSIAPLFETNSRALLLTLFFGAFGAGAATANLVKEATGSKEK